MLSRRKIYNLLFTLNLRINSYLPNWILNSRKPDFLIVGSAKCATTYLKENLLFHPDISMPKYEVNYFSFHQNKGIDWYHSHFWQHTKLSGEKSPSYIYSTNIHKDIYSTLPNAKLILILREPVKRAYSNWNMRINNNSIGSLKGVDVRNFDKLTREYISRNIPDKIVAQNPLDIFHMGKYVNQIESLLTYYPKENIFIRIMEEITDSSESIEIFYKQLCQFLSIDYHYRYFNSQKIRTGKYKKNNIPQQAEKLLKETYRPYNERLFQFFGRKISSWS